ncbi:VanZ family protein [Sporosarcina sp. JAI121]|uniref:VanZ family protein n=1 Tax=Sporosarcina sp. JAI121 TaxID=2723064 RepID=UPI0015CD5124|nr:VanZ family protein [Sporosarcina sp. JAI121]NYF25236.1 glycopeptide antibiotics resistance protein [Sporosarcina sp. JAI121]
MSTILGYISEMIPYLFVALPIILLYRTIYNRMRGYGKTNVHREIGVTFFLVFMTALFSQTILTFLYTGPAVTRSFSNVNLIPFRVFLDNYYAITELNYWQPFIINFLGNICIFMPIGFMIPLLWSRFDRFWKVAFIGLGISLFIETIQLTQARSSDIDDLWLNTTGSMLGYCTFLAIKKLFPAVPGFFKKSNFHM